MSLGDVARLAGVKRPVPSMWRKRYAASELAFPVAVSRVGQADRFDAAAVVRWLEATGRGRAGEVRADAAAFASPTTTGEDTATHGGLSGLLCLKAVTGRDLAGLDPDELRRLALSADPMDILLRREVSSLAEVEAWASRADELSEAAYGPAAALDGLVERQRRAVGGTVDLAPVAHAMVVSLATALAREAGHEPPVYADATVFGSDLLLSIGKAEAAIGAEVVLPSTGSPRTRALHRRVRAHEVHVGIADDVSITGPHVLIAHYADPAAVREQVLDDLDELMVAMTPEQRGLVLAPASLLIDRLNDRGLHQQRSRTLRTGGVRAVVRLPAGLVPGRPREALALWVLGPDFGSGLPQDRKVALIDVSARRLDSLVIDQLRDDVLATLGDPSRERAHHFALARRVPTSTVLAQSGSLLPVATAVRERAGGAALALSIERLRAGAELRSDPLGDATVQVDEHAVPPAITLGHAVNQRVLRVVPGNREGFVLASDGSVPVLGVDEVSGQRPLRSRYLDRLAFLGSHTAARLTEPGDVVFGTSPRPRALVDEDGGSAVPYPARILRRGLGGGEGLCPRVLAYSISALPSRAGPWRSWLVPRVAGAQAARLDGALHAMDRHEAALRERLDELNHLRTALVHAVTSGALTITDPKDD